MLKAFLGARGHESSTMPVDQRGACGESLRVVVFKRKVRREELMKTNKNSGYNGTTKRLLNIGTII